MREKAPNPARLARSHEDARVEFVIALRILCTPAKPRDEDRRGSLEFSRRTYVGDDRNVACDRYHLECPRASDVFMRRALSDAVISTTALALLLTMLVSVDPRLRGQARSAISSPGPSVSLVMSEVRGVSRTAWDGVQVQTFATAPMAMFGIAAVVLVLFVLRT